MRISIASDHGGFHQKQALARHLESMGHTVLDRGCDSEDSVDYPDYAEIVGEDVAVKEAERGILVCGTGIGMAIAANKIRGVRAANVTSVEFAQLAREHNDANVLTLSGRFVPLTTNTDIVEAFLTTPFAGDRHDRRVKKIQSLEQ